MTKLCNCVLLLAIIAMAAFPSRACGEVIYQSQLDEGSLGKYQLVVVGLGLQADTREQQIRDTLALAKKNPDVVKLEVVEKGGRQLLMVTTLGKLKDVAASQAAIEERSLKTLIVRQDCGGSKYFRGSATSVEPVLGRCIGRAVWAGAQAKYIDKNRHPVSVIVHEYQDAVADGHEVLRQVKEWGVELVDSGGSTVLFLRRPITGPGRVWCASQPSTQAGSSSKPARLRIEDLPLSEGTVVWLSGGKRIVGISWDSVPPVAVIQAYLSLLPSGIPVNMSVDFTSWGRDEMECWLGRMTDSLKDGAAASRPTYSYDECRQMIMDSVFVPILFDRGAGRAASMPTVDVRRLELAAVTEWWKRNREQSYWASAEYQGAPLVRLYGPGQTPQELSHAEVDKDLQRVRVKLAEAVTPEKMASIVAEASAAFEKRMTSRSARRGGSFKLIGEQTWEWQWVYAEGAPKAKAVFRGPPVIMETGKPESPFKATFKGEGTGAGPGDKNPYEETLTYSKLRGCWE